MGDDEDEGAAGAYGRTIERLARIKADVPRFWLRFSCVLADGRWEGRGPRVGGGGDVEQFEDLEL